MAILYASEKLQAAVKILASSPKPLNERLDAAVSEVFLLEAERDFPEEFRQEFNNLIKQIGEYRNGNKDELIMFKLADSIFYLLINVERKYDFIINKMQDYNQK